MLKVENVKGEGRPDDQLVSSLRASIRNARGIVKAAERSSNVLPLTRSGIKYSWRFKVLEDW